MENQLLQEDASSEQGSVVGGPPEVGRRGGTSRGAPVGAPGGDAFTFNLSFEELSTLGLEEPPRPVGVAWMVSAAAWAGSGRFPW